MVVFRAKAEASGQGSALEKEASQVECRNIYMCFLKVLITQGLDYISSIPGGRRDLKSLSKYPCVKGFKPLHNYKDAKTPKALVRFLSSIVILPLWKGELMPTTKHLNLIAFSKTSQFIFGDIK